VLKAAELDLLLHVRGRRYGFEVKRADAPHVTKSMRIALDDLSLDHVFVVFPGDVEMRLHERIHGVGLARIADPSAAWRKRVERR
jgi:hypothetical protein